MPAVARFDLKMDNDEKELLARAAALQGTTMAAFVRVAAKEKARELLERESLLVMSLRRRPGSDPLAAVAVIHAGLLGSDLAGGFRT